MRHLDLFSGIGGFSLGLESTGMYETVALCEIDPFCRRVLAKHWPDLPCYEDVRDVGSERLVADGIGRIDIVTGGFPCQDVSLAGARAGLSGERSGLWSELFRVVTEVRPAWVIVENVVGLRTLGGDQVLAELAGADYACWPLVVGAVHAGAPHRRQRVWIVAHTESEQMGRSRQSRGCECVEAIAHATGERCGKAGARELEPYGQDATNANSHAVRTQQGWGESGRAGDIELEQWDWSRAPEPVLRRVDDGLPCGMDRRKRLTALGNAVVPQVVASLGRAIAGDR